MVKRDPSVRLSVRSAGAALFLLAAIVVALTLSACGSSDPQGSSVTVASVGHSTITRGVLSHWMNTMVGGDYNESVGGTAPAGLVSDPPNYAACVRASEAALHAAKNPVSIPTAQKLRGKCRQLYVAIKEQALGYLLSALWLAEEAAEGGYSVSSAEVQRELQGVKATQYPKPGQFASYLLQKHWSVADELYLLKRNLLDTRFLERLHARAGQGGGSEQEIVRLARQNIAKWSARTRCSAGYRAWQCPRFKTSMEAWPSAAVLLEQLGGIVGG